ncbi:hypothetical protein NAEGRDRAFT_78745 [Naegleria gruberi]|uniref:Uncharacterized protein n=1 Tax=Naegleria gruberi TaxID=5762 RepID=D2V659_NAEGR|nr:uncharacterized protein NAEGRDRAFT_78745 [Naegleria gruberi]EFC47908.1 hypothetical protein NAEGRDRAFT_78745 [Naegleria gruberi]|eukprot:XP_002680652.1 hypothetical protein NAEGRDRAFT_78745 [Naegleria gruberi strain NEG-M]
MTRINNQKTVEENTSQLNHNPYFQQEDSNYEEEVPTLIIHSSSPPSSTPTTVAFDYSNSSKTVSSNQPQLSLNLQINQNYYSNSFDSPVSIISQSEEEIDESDLEFASFKSVSNQYFQVSSPIQQEEPVENQYNNQEIQSVEMMNASNNNNNYQQPMSQDSYKSSAIEYGMHQEASVPYNDNLSTSHDSSTTTNYL